MTQAYLSRATCLEHIDVFVLAGGLGTRVQAILRDRPKLLAPVAGRPYLDYLVDWLKGYGARRIVLGLGYLADAVLAYLAANPPAGIKIDTIVEPAPLGTAGAIRYACAKLTTDPVMVLNGDSLIDADLPAFVARHVALGCAGTLLCTEVEDASRYGRVVLDRQGLIAQFIEKEPDRHEPGIVSAGVYLLSRGLLRQIATSTAVSLEHDVFERLAPGSLATQVGRYRFIDIGTPQSLATATAPFASA